MTDVDHTEAPHLDYHDVLDAERTEDAVALTIVSLSLALQRARAASSASWGLLDCGTDKSGSEGVQERQGRFEQELRSGQFGTVRLDVRPAGKPSRRLYLVLGIARVRLARLITKYGPAATLYTGPETGGSLVARLQDGTEMKGGAPSPAEIVRLYSEAVGTPTAFEYPVQGFSEALIRKARGRVAAKSQPDRFRLNLFYHFGGLHVERELARVLLSVLSALDPTRARLFIQSAFLSETPHASTYTVADDRPLGFDVRYSIPAERLTAENGLTVALTYEGDANTNFDSMDQVYEDSAHNSASDARIVDPANDDLTILIECQKGSWQSPEDLQRHMTFQFVKGTPAESAYRAVGWCDVVVHLRDAVQEGGNAREIYLTQQLAEYLSLLGLVDPEVGMPKVSASTTNA